MSQSDVSCSNGNPWPEDCGFYIEQKKNHFREISWIYMYYSCSTPDTSSYIGQETNLLALWYILQLTPISSRSGHWVYVGGLIHIRQQTKIVFQHGGEFPTLDAQEHASQISCHPAESAGQQRACCHGECDQHHIYQVCLLLRFWSMAVKNSIPSVSRKNVLDLSKF
jgi:hypothetical protein